MRARLSNVLSKIATQENVTRPANKPVASTVAQMRTRTKIVRPRLASIASMLLVERSVIILDVCSTVAIV